MLFHEIPPTGGLPVKWRDWLPTAENLTEKISKCLNLPPMLLTCSGTAALIVALTTLKQNNPTKKWVIIPAYTCPLVALAIHHCGLKIKLCDNAISSFDFDFEHLSHLIDDQTLAIIPTHLGGQIADVASAKQLASPYQISIIEDGAQALGADIGQHGDMVFFSLAAGKGLTLYEGGLLATQNATLRSQLEATIQSLIPHKSAFEFKRILELLGYTMLYNPTGLAFIYGLERRKWLKKGQLIEAVGDLFDFTIPLHQVSKCRQNVAIHAIDRLPDFIFKTTQQAQQRIKQLEQLANVKVVKSRVVGNAVWPFLMVLLPTQSIRDNILNELWTSPLGVTRLFIYDLPNYAYLSELIPPQKTPNATDFAQRMLTITNSLWLNDEQFNLIYQTIVKYLVQ